MMESKWKLSGAGVMFSLFRYKLKYNRLETLLLDQGLHAHQPLKDQTRKSKVVSMFVNLKRVDLTLT
jgi:hypothetical protein